VRGWRRVAQVTQGQSAIGAAIARPLRVMDKVRDTDSS